MLMVDESSDEHLLKCSTCNKPLSVAPIYHNVTIGSVCGRCAQNGLIDGNSDACWERQIIVENIANYLLFPCSYQVFGCMVELQWDSVVNHEDTCPYSDIVCPLSHEYFGSQCSWIDDHYNLTKHIKRKHKNMFCIPPSMKITEKCENNVLFSEIAGNLIIIMLIFNNELNKYSCYLFGEFSLEECNSYRCQVNISSIELANPVKLRNVPMQPFARNYLKRVDGGVEIDLNEHLKNISPTTNDLLLSFNVLKERNSEETQFDAKLLQELECPICYELMKPPIFICEKGHNICEVCCNKVDRCPVCRKNLLGGRNFTLETLASKVNYPCVNRHLGCTYIAMLPQIEDHQRDCSYVARKCFVGSCQWEGLNTSFENHLEDKHLNNLLKLDTFKVHHINMKNQDYIMIHDDDIFVLKFSFDNKDNLKYAVLHYGREVTSYKYNLILKDPTCGISITLSNCCEPVLTASDIMHYNNSFTSLPFSFLSQFLLNFHQIEFKLHIQYEN
ncbi:uncharacterized protein LOC123311687 [Coccinella septempunctata]|uniref:uncharacterized protein LOC123311687 n=1 Tax=Coccinella septempunctata TaxID=41139 RepID=UPI001D068273|nr:uncharacterized protein LOC123311687 [Coccinella septempunctata]